MGNSKCFANLHLSMAEHSLWDVCRSISFESGGVFRFDGRYFASLYKGTDKNRIYRTVDGLIKTGWFEVIKERERDPKTGKWLSAIYRVRSVEEWGKRNPHRHEPVPKETSPTGENGEPVPKEGQAPVPKNAKPVPNFEKPVPRAGHSSDGCIDGNTANPRIEQKPKQTVGAVDWLRKFGTKRLGAFPIHDRERIELNILSERDGLETFKQVCKRWYDKRQSFEGLNYPAGKLVEEYEDHLSVIREEQRRDTWEAEIRADMQRQAEEKRKQILEIKPFAEIAHVPDDPFCTCPTCRAGDRKAEVA